MLLVGQIPKSNHYTQVKLGDRILRSQWGGGEDESLGHYRIL